jgi:CubicO group peptidase (beta-lactamase class C family)
MNTNSATETSFDARFDILCQQVQLSMEKQHVPGVVIGVWQAGKESIRGLGITNIEHPLPVTPETLYQVGSITKTFLATAVMRLVEMGKIELATPLRAWIPDLRLSDETTAANVTMRHLLTHTGGWEGDYFDDFGRGEDALANMILHMADLPQITPLGKFWSYNNAGFYLAGRVIEIVTGKSFEAAIQELVFDPLGLKSTYFFPEDILTHLFVVGHETEDDQVKVARPWALGRAIHSAGGVISNAHDLLEYARFHMGDVTAPDGNRLLQAQTLEQMHTPLLPATGLRQMALGWFTLTLDGVKLLRHTGGTNGQITLLAFAPQRQFALVALTNSSDGDGVIDTAETTALEQFLGVTVPQPAPLELATEQLEPYTGCFESGDASCCIKLEDDRLVLHMAFKGGFPTPAAPPPPPLPPMIMALCAPDQFFVIDGPMKGSRGEYLRDDQGRVAWLRIDGRIRYRK